MGILGIFGDSVGIPWILRVPWGFFRGFSGIPWGFHGDPLGILEDSKKYLGILGDSGDS